VILADRVRWDDLTLKPNLSNLMRLRFRALRDQLGYKLPVLLTARVRDQTLGANGARPKEVLVGDDAEADAFVYSLYADVCAGTVDAAQLKRILRAGRVYSDQRALCLRRLPEVRNDETVERILIHLEGQTPPSRFDGYGRRLVPFYNYLQAGFVLCEDGRLSGDAVLRIASVFVLRHRFEAEALARSYLDLMRRGHAVGACLPALEAALAKAGDDPARDPLGEMVDLIGAYCRNPPARTQPQSSALDYSGLAVRHRFGKNRKRFQGFA
jgi:hypothetical protein